MPTLGIDLVLNNLATFKYVPSPPIVVTRSQLLFILIFFELETIDAFFFFSLNHADNFFAVSFDFLQSFL